MTLVVLRALALGAALLIASPLRAVPTTRGDAPDDIRRLARSSVDARFTPDPAHPDHDLLTGQSREQLEAAAREYYEDLARRDPERFQKLRSRMLGEPSADDLDAAAMIELKAGRPASAELAWQRLVEEHPDSPNAGPALVKLASSRLTAGDRAGAAANLAKLPEMDAELSYQAAPMMSRLLADIDAELARRPTPPRGSDKVSLHPSLQSGHLDRVRELSEWTAGYTLLDSVARELRLETSGDVLRVIKGLGDDEVKLDTLVSLVPLEHRIAAVQVEEYLKDPTDPQGSRTRGQERSKPKSVAHFEGLARLQQLQILLLARTLEDLELEPEARRLGDHALQARRALAAQVERLAATPAPREGAPSSLSPEEIAVGRLARLSDWNGDGHLTSLQDDEGLWRRHRMAVEGDMVNAVTKPLDDDNDRATADLFQQTGLSEQALLAALIRSTTNLEGSSQLFRVSPELTDRLLAELAARSAPVWAAAPHPKVKPRDGDAERDYLARLNVLRLPGEALEDVIAREILAPRSPVGTSALMANGRSGRLVVELASLGQRVDGAWVHADDEPSVPDARTATEKLDRAQVIRGELDDVSAGLALDEMSTVLISDLESQGYKFTPGQRREIHDKIQHEDLGTLAFTFDEFGSFSGIQNAGYMVEPGSALGTKGSGHVAYGFGLDLTSGAPAANVGWRDDHEMRDGAAMLSYHIGGAASPAGPADVSGVSAEFRRKKVWRPEVGADASILRGLMGRGFLNLVRDVNLKHERKVARVFEDHEAAREQGRTPFVDSTSADGAPAKPAVLFAQSLGHSDGDMKSDAQSFRVLSDSYEFEKERQRSLLDREASKVRFAGIGFTGLFFAGDIYLLVGPKIAVKDFRMYSRAVNTPSLRLQSEEAQMRRAAITTGPATGTIHRKQTTYALNRAPDADGRTQFKPSATTDRVETAELSARRLFTAPARPLVAKLASMGSSSDLGIPGIGIGIGIGGAGGGARSNVDVDIDADRAERQRERGLARLTRAFRARGVPLAVSAGDCPHEYVLSPAWLTPWCSQALEIYANADDGLGLAVDARGLPILIAPDGLDGVVLDALQERRSVSRPGESDELWRLSFSMLPGRPAAAIIGESARLLRCEIVDGAFIGAAVMATKLRRPDGSVRGQTNIVAPSDPGASAQIARLDVAAGQRKRPPLPDPPAVALRAAEPEDDGSISDPAALSPTFLASLMGASRADLTAFKTRGIQFASLQSSKSSGPSQQSSGLEPENVSYIQAKSVGAHGRPLSGAALEHAHFMLTHQGLYRGDTGSVAEQASVLEMRAVTPFAPDREIGHAADPASRRIIEKAGIDEEAALREIGSGMKDSVARARATGKLDHETIEPGTRIITASWSGPAKGVQWTTATQPVDAHLLPPLSLATNEGRYVVALGLGPDVPALAQAVAAQTGLDPGLLEPEIEDGIARALAGAGDSRILRAPIAGGEIVLTLARAPRAGALARCKNATLFPPAYGALFERPHAVVIAAAPAAWIGTAETAPHFEGQSCVGWRRLSLIAGGLLGGAVAAANNDDDDDGGTTEPPRDGGAPPPRDGGRARPPDRPVTPEDDGVVITPPRDGDQPPGRGGGRGQPPDREKPPGGETEEPPRDGQPPPGRPGPGRPDPPDPSDRPRRPVD